MSNRCSAVLDEVHRVVLGLLQQIADETRVDSLLDVGCGDGRRTADYLRAASPRQAFGVDVFPDLVEAASGRGIAAVVVDLERDPFPWPDRSMDVVVCN